MSVRRTLALVWSIGAFLLMLWGWATYSGPYLWAAEWQLAHFGYYEVKITLLAPLLLLLIPAGFVGGWGPLMPPQPVNRATHVANAMRNARIITVVGAVALLIGAAGGAIGYWRMRTPPTLAELDLSKAAEPTPVANLVRITAVARTDLMVGYRETVAGVTSHWSFVPLVSPAWRPGEPVRFVLKTNQTAWLPPGGGLPRMLQAGSPSFQMTTAPSVLKRYDMPGIVRAEYDKARVALDPSLAVVEQSPGEVYAPYWMIAAGGGLVGVCMLFAGLIGALNARRSAPA